MKQIFTYLSQLEFSPIESKLYLLLLKSGPLTVSELAQTAKINRTATYSYIASLLEKGVIAKVKGVSNKIIPNPPEHLQYLVEQRITSVMTLKETLPNVINMLNTSFPQVQNATSSEIKYFKGRTGVKTIYEECLNSQIIRSYFNSDDIKKTFPENVKIFNKALNHNPEMSIFEIVENTPQANASIEFSKKNEPNHFWKVLPADIKLTSNDILIYNRRVAIINIGDKNNITGVVLHNKDYYNNSVQLFDLLWRLLPDSDLQSDR